MFIITGCFFLGLLFILYITLSKALSKGGDVFEKYNIWLYGLITVNVFVLLLIMLFVFYRSQYGNKGSEGSKGTTGERGDIGNECKIKALTEESKKNALFPDKCFYIKTIKNKKCKINIK